MIGPHNDKLEDQEPDRAKGRRVAFLDVFAEQPLAGNGLAVVDAADDLADEVMLAFAQETRLAETSFVQAPTSGSADYRNRIWTPGGELAFAGHPSLGVAVAVARWRGEDEAAYVQQTGAGLQPVEARRSGEAGNEGERWRASMLQGPAEFGAELDPATAMRAAGLDVSDADPELAPQVVSVGIPHVLAPLAGEEALGRVRPDYEAIDALLRPHEAVVLYLAFYDPEPVGEAAGSARARSFAGVAELGEDPATGSAAGPLCAYLGERTGCTSIRVVQGVEMGRPSVLDAALEGDRIRVSGGVIPIVDGAVELSPRS